MGETINMLSFNADVSFQSKHRKNAFPEESLALILWHKRASTKCTYYNWKQLKPIKAGMVEMYGNEAEATNKRLNGNSWKALYLFRVNIFPKMVKWNAVLRETGPM